MTKPMPRIGVDKLFFALVTSDTTASAVYGAPKQLPGVSSIGYKPNSQVVKYFADDGVYAVSHGDGGVEVEIKVADLLPEDYATLIGAQISSTGVVEEYNKETPPEVAIGYRSLKSNGYYRYEWLMKGQFSKPDQESATKGESIENKDRTIKFTPMNRVSDGKVRRFFDSDGENVPVGLSDSDLVNASTGWFSGPDYVPVASGTPLSDVAASTGASTGEISLAFTAPTGATSVRAQIETFDGTWAYVATKAALNASSTSVIIENLTAGNTYNCRLVVAGGASNGVSNADSASAAV